MGEEEYDLDDGQTEGGSTLPMQHFPSEPESGSDSEADMVELRRIVLASKAFTSPLTPASSGASSIKPPDFNQYPHTDSEEEDSDEGGVNIADAYPAAEGQGPSIIHGLAMKENEELFPETIVAAPGRVP